jgi:NADH-quinone oxidoreductase subunit G
VLPIVPFTETSGTFVSMEGRAQAFHAVVNPLGEARPGWKVLRMLGTLLEVPGFEFETLEAVRADIGTDLPAKVCASVSNAPAPLSFTLAPAPNGVERIAEWPLYGTDPLVRRAPSLQRSAQAKAGRTVRMNAATAASLSVAAGGHVRISQGDGETILPVAIDTTLPDQCVRIACSTAEAANLGEGAVTLAPVAVGAAA